jgi:hypothetical protein
MRPKAAEKIKHAGKQGVILIWNGGLGSGLLIRV